MKGDGTTGDRGSFGRMRAGGDGEAAAPAPPTAWRLGLALAAVGLLFWTLFFGGDSSDGGLTWLGTFSPWSPHMDAWSGVATPVEYVTGRSPLELSRRVTPAVLAGMAALLAVAVLRLL